MTSAGERILREVRTIFTEALISLGEVTALINDPRPSPEKGRDPLRETEISEGIAFFKARTERKIARGRDLLKDLPEGDPGGRLLEELFSTLEKYSDF